MTSSKLQTRATTTMDEPTKAPPKEDEEQLNETNVKVIRLKKQFQTKRDGW
jgi:hypothetical protein